MVKPHQFLLEVHPVRGRREFAHMATYVSVGNILLRVDLHSVECHGIHVDHPAEERPQPHVEQGTAGIEQRVGLLLG